MNSISQHYDDLERALDDVRGLLNEWLSEMDEDPMSTWVAGDSRADPPSPDDGASSEQSSSDSDAPSANARPDSSDLGSLPPDEFSSSPRSKTSGSSQVHEPGRPGIPGHENDPSQGRPSVIRYVQVVLHEWIANLIQHAEFGQTPPHVDIFIRLDERHIFCSVTDNSEGFDLQAQLAKQRNQARVLPERGMGLRFISACTQECSYGHTESGRYRFEFSIPVDHDPWLSMLF